MPAGAQFSAGMRMDHFGRGFRTGGFAWCGAAFSIIWNCDFDLKCYNQIGQKRVCTVVFCACAIASFWLFTAFACAAYRQAKQTALVHYAKNEPILQDKRTNKRYNQ